MIKMNRNFSQVLIIFTVLSTINFFIGFSGASVYIMTDSCKLIIFQTAKSSESPKSYTWIRLIKSYSFLKNDKWHWVKYSPEKKNKIAICPKLYGNCAFPQNFHTRKLFHAVYLVTFCQYFPRIRGSFTFSILMKNSLLKA